MDFRPLVQKMEVVAVDGIDPVHCLIKLLFLKSLPLGSLASARRSFRPAFRSDRQSEIGDQFSGGLIGSQGKELRREIDHIAFLLTAEANEILIDLHARCPIIMERTTGHAGAVHFDAVMLGGFAGADLFFDLGVDPQKRHLLSFRK